MSEEPALTQRDVEALRTTLDKLDHTLMAFQQAVADIYVRKDVFDAELRPLRAEVAEHGDWIMWAQRIVIGAVMLAILGAVLVQGG